MLCLFQFFGAVLNQIRQKKTNLCINLEKNIFFSFNILIAKIEN